MTDEAGRLGTNVRWQGHARSSPGYRRILIALFVGGVATFAQLYSFQAVLPRIALELRLDAGSAALTVSMATIGLALGVIPWSVVADRIGRVRAMALAICAASAVGLAVPFAPSFGLMLGGRVLEGLMVGGLPAIAITYLVEEIEARSTTRAAGVYVAGTTVGGLTGRLVAGPLAELVSWRMAVFAVAVLCAVASVLFLRLIPPSRRPAPAVQPHELRGLSAQLGRHFRSRRLLVMLAQALLLMGGFVAMYNFVGFRLSAAPFELPPSVVSLVFLAYLAGTWSSVQAGVLAARWGRLPVLIVCTAVMIIGVCATTLDALVAVLIGIVLTTLGFFGAHSIASEWVGHEAIADRAQASSLYNLFYYAGSSLFGWFGGVLYASSGWPATAGMIMFLAFAAGLMALSALRGPGPAELQQARRDRG